MTERKKYADFHFLIRRTKFSKAALHNLMYVKDFVLDVDSLLIRGEYITDEIIYKIAKTLYFRKRESGERSGEAYALYRAVKNFSKVLYGDDMMWLSEYESWSNQISNCEVIEVSNERTVIRLANEEYVRRLGQLYEKVLSLRDDDDYIINQPQMDKLIEVLNFFLDIAQKCNGKVEPVKLIPRAEHGGVTATFIVFDIYGDDIQKYCDVMRHTSAITIDSTTEGVCISVTVPEVFVPIEDRE